MLKLYQNIKDCRIMRGMSQEELAKRVGYSNRSAIARIENGEIDLPQSKILAIAEALRVDPGVLMGSDGSSEKTAIGLDFGTTFSAAIPNNILAYIACLNSDGLKKAEEYLADISDMEKYKK